MKQLTILTFILTLFAAPVLSGQAWSEPVKQEIQTYGIHHVGLAVKDLQLTADFFTETLDFEVVGGKPDYPSIFVSDGTVTVTLWQAAENATAFDRKANIGLHHLAFKLDSFEDLDAMHKKIKDHPGIKIEFAPELVNGGPAKHMIFYEPGGIRLEFFASPKA